MLKQIILGLLFGGAFGFVLHKVQATDPNKIIGFLRLTDMHLAKVILFAIGFSSLLLFVGLAIGFIPASHIHVKASYIGVILGGAIFGVGFGLGGYCPGTTVAAWGAGRKDAIFMILGGLLGAWAFVLSYGWLLNNMSWLFDSVVSVNDANKITLAETGNPKNPALFNLPGIIVAGVLAIIFIAAAFWVPDQIRSTSTEN
jgi:uncharacterized membrane protein YedE/YeeE